MKSFVTGTVACLLPLTAMAQDVLRTGADGSDAQDVTAIMIGPTFVETFDEGNTGGWSYFGNPDNGLEFIDDDGGVHGAFWHSPCEAFPRCLDTFAPQPRTQLGVDSVFLGDYRARNVSRIGVDLITFYVDFSAAGRPLSIMLVNDNGTPLDTGDDLVVYRKGGAMIPQPGQGWRRFNFRIPSQSNGLPPNWVVSRGGGLDDDTAWNTIITDVDRVQFFYGDPELFFIFQQWDVGLDNVSISSR